MPEDRLSYLKQQGNRLWNERDRMIKNMRSLRYMENPVEVPAAIEAEVVRSPVAYNIVERMVGSMTTEDPQIVVPPKDKSLEARRDSSNMEKATAAILKELDRQQDTDVFERFIESLLADGHACMRMFYAPQLWNGYPDRDDDEAEGRYNERADDWVRYNRIPIHWAWVDPLNVYPFWSEMGLHHVLEIDKRDVLTLDPTRYNELDEVTWEHLSKISREHQSGMVEFAQLWTPDELVYWIDGKRVHRQAHNYHRPPYVYATGVSPSSSKAKYKGLSILYPLRFLIPYLDRLLTQKATAVRLWCWPTPVFKAGEQSPTGEIRSIDVEPGKTVSLFPDEEIGFLTWQGNGPDADEMLRVINSMIEKAGIADILFGQSLSGDSGYLANQLITAARMKFKPITKHANRAMEQMIQCLWDIIEYQIERPIYVYPKSIGESEEGWIELGPDDLQGYRHVKVNIQPLLPTDEYAKSSQAINELRAGLRSKSSAMEMIGIEQPEEMKDEILLDAWMQNSQVQAALTQEMLRRYNIMKEEGQQEPTVQDVASQMGQMSPGLRQALLVQSMGGNSGVQAAPGVSAMPPPSGIGTGRAPGAQRQGLESRGG